MCLGESFFVLCLAWQNLVFEFVRAGFGKDHWDSNFNFFIHTYKVTEKTRKSEKKNAILFVCSLTNELISRTDIPPAWQPYPFCQLICKM